MAQLLAKVWPEGIHSHVFNLTGGIVPMPLSAQFQSQTAAAQIRLLSDQTTHQSEHLQGALSLGYFGLYAIADTIVMSRDLNSYETYWEKLMER